MLHTPPLFPLFGLTLPVSNPLLQHLYTPDADPRTDTRTQLVRAS